MPDAIALTIFSGRLTAVCDEMGAVLARTAFSVNIKERLDYSCAVFDADGRLCAQAAHIPVHLGSMAYAMRDIVGAVDWRPGDMVMLNDPYLGGTHLPDVTLIAPLFIDTTPVAFVANRAHHADIGAESPGSMPISTCLDEEGVVIAPTHLLRDGKLQQEFLDALIARLRNPDQARGDFAAQAAANHTGLTRLRELIDEQGVKAFRTGLIAVNNYAERLATDALSMLPPGEYRFKDVMDDDGLGHTDLPIAVTVTVRPDTIHIDFTGTAAQTPGNINCPLPVTAAAVYYVFRCLMPAHTPACAGAFRGITLHAPAGCLLNACRPAAVAAGNVETSTRIVDVVLGALAQAIPQRIPAASHGSMNNLAMGSVDADASWDYYETLGGGMGAGATGGGLHGVQTHMTNTRNTPIEVLEMRYPLRVRNYSLRRDSGGRGLRNGGDGLIRAYEFLRPTEVTLLTERRRHAPWGLAAGRDGAPGVNLYNGRELPPKLALTCAPGDRLTVVTPGGGGWGEAPAEDI